MRHTSSSRVAFRSASPTGENQLRKGLTPDDLGDLLELPLVAVLATYRRDGTVLLSRVWHEWHDNGFNVVTGQRNVTTSRSNSSRCRGRAAGWVPRTTTGTGAVYEACTGSADA